MQAQGTADREGVRKQFAEKKIRMMKMLGIKFISKKVDITIDRFRKKV